MVDDNKPSWNDEQLKKVLVGTWHSEATYAGASWVVDSYLRPDFSEVSIATMTQAGSDVSEAYFDQGAWTVNQSKFVAIITESSVPEYPGIEIINPILQASANKLVVANSEGIEITMDRDPSTIPSDEQYQDILTGCWFSTVMVVGVAWGFVTQLSADGVYVAGGYRVVDGKHEPILDTGTWKVENGDLHYVMKDATRPEDKDLNVVSAIIFADQDYAIISDQNNSWNDMQQTEPPGDDDIHRRIVGTWSGIEVVDGTRSEFEMKFSEDGKWTNHSTTTAGDGSSSEVSESGSYSVFGGLIIITPEGASPRYCDVVYLSDLLIGWLNQAEVLVTAIPAGS